MKKCKKSFLFFLILSCMLMPQVFAAVGPPTQELSIQVNDLQGKPLAGIQVDVEVYCEPIAGNPTTIKGGGITSASGIVRIEQPVYHSKPGLIILRWSTAKETIKMTTPFATGKVTYTVVPSMDWFIQVEEAKRFNLGNCYTSPM